MGCSPWGCKELGTTEQLTPLVKSLQNDCVIKITCANECLRGTSYSIHQNSTCTFPATPLSTHPRAGVTGVCSRLSCICQLTPSPSWNVNLAWLPWNPTPCFPGAPSQLIPGRLLRQLGVSQGQDWPPFSPLHVHMYFLADLSYSSGFQYHRHAVTPKVLSLVWVLFDLKFIVNYLSPIFHNSTA